MTDSRPPDPPDPPDDGGDDLYKRVAALSLYLPLVAALPVFIRCICTDICKNPDHADDKHLASNESLKKLCTSDGMWVAYKLWRLSRYPGAEALEALGMKSGEEYECPTCTSLGKEARTASGFPEDLIASITEESCIICCRRIVDAMIYFGYAEKRMESKSYRPVYATSRLDPVMMEFISAIEPLLREAAERLAAFRAEQTRKKNGPTKDGGTDGEEGE